MLELNWVGHQLESRTVTAEEGVKDNIHQNSRNPKKRKRKKKKSEIVVGGLRSQTTSLIKGFPPSCAHLCLIACELKEGVLPLGWNHRSRTAVSAFFWF